jgi:hypothetical protein
LEYAIGEWVWLWLLHRSIASLEVQARGKMGPKFYSPFMITEWIGDVAYRLQQPADAKLHDIFHVGLLKKYRVEPPIGSGVLPPIHHGRACPMPESIVKGCLARGRRELLVRWVGQDLSGAS